MAKHIIIDDDVADLFEDYYDDERHRVESLVKRAVVQLVANHRAEYEELASDVLQNEVDKLKMTVSRQSDRIRKLEALNPKMVNVPILTETANRLQKAVEARESKKLRRRKK